MRLRTRLARVEGRVNVGRPVRYVIQEDDGATRSPSDEECDAREAALAAEGYEPRRIIVQYVNRGPWNAAEDQ